MKKLVLPICILILGLIGGLGAYVWQNGETDPQLARQRVLQKQLADAKKAYDTVKATGEVETESWEQYCDPVASFCFKYPKDWVLEDSVNDYGGGDKRVGATVTNPGKTVTIRYANPFIKDGSAGSAHIVDVSEITVSSQKIRLIGSYPVASGNYSPGYMYANVDSIAGGTPGSIGHDLSSSLFTIGKYTSISLSGNYIGSQKLTSRAQAEAWFHSIDGKTTKIILSSLSAK